MNYTPHTPEDISSMLASIGVQSIEELFSPIPASLRAKHFNLPAGKSEHEVFEQISALGKKNNSPLLSFLGGGYYDHVIPAVVDALTSRGEFFTAYTPYQPEASQGTLQALFEYQSAICALTGMDVSNASMYDGGTALAEAVLMALRITGKNKVIIDKSVNPLHREIVHTYLKFRSFEIIEIDPRGYALDRETLLSLINDDTAAVVLENPNFFGTVDDFTDIAEALHRIGSLLIVSAYPISLGLVKTPGEMGADIAVGEGQSLGNPLSFGGPYLGIITSKKEYVRNLPGRICGETVDHENRRAFVLTLQAREQHIKRHKATSNICSNQGLCALRALIFLSSLGKNGLREMAQLNYSISSFAKERLKAVKGVKISTCVTFNTFVLELPSDASLVAKKLLNKNIAAGIPLSLYYPALKNHLLVTVTEKISCEAVEQFAKQLEASL